MPTSTIDHGPVTPPPVAERDSDHPPPGNDSVLGRLGGGLTATWLGFRHYGLAPLLAGVISVAIFGFLAVGLCERWLPYRQDWLRSHHDIGVDITHLIINNGVVEKLLVALLATTLAGSSDWLAQRLGFSTWPHQWPLAAQLVLCTLAAYAFARYVFPGKQVLFALVRENPPSDARFFSECLDGELAVGADRFAGK